MATEEEQKIMMAFVTASSSEAAKAVAQQNPLLMHPGALKVLDQLTVTAQQKGNTTTVNQLNVARQRLTQIQSGK
jgi:hypothetical protein